MCATGLGAWWRAARPPDYDPSFVVQATMAHSAAHAPQPHPWRRSHESGDGRVDARLDGPGSPGGRSTASPVAGSDELAPLGQAGARPGGEPEETPSLSLLGAVLTMAAISVVVAFSSEILSDSIEAFQARTGLSEAFVGMVLLPVAGNACEHLTAVMVAMKNKMDLALAVAVGSSIQIATFVIPFTVLVAWCLRLDFALDFDAFSCVVLTMSVVLAALTMADGRSHYITGVVLVVAYVLIALCYLWMPGAGAGDDGP